MDAPTPSEYYLFFSMLVGFVVSLLLVWDTIRDHLAARKQPRDDPRRPLALGLLVFSLGYLVLKIVILYLATGLIFEQVPHRALVGRVGLAAAINLTDICVAVFWYLRKKAL
jgi:hypothetical protein